MTEHYVGRGAPGGIAKFADGHAMAVRYPGDLRTRLKQAAAENKRSLNAEIMTRLEASFGSAPIEPQASTFATLHPLNDEIAAAVERHIQGEVQARLIKLARVLTAGGE